MWFGCRCSTAARRCTRMRSANPERYLILAPNSSGMPRHRSAGGMLRGSNFPQGIWRGMSISFFQRECDGKTSRRSLLSGCTSCRAHRRSFGSRAKASPERFVRFLQPGKERGSRSRPANPIERWARSAISMGHPVFFTGGSGRCAPPCRPSSRTSRVRAA